MAALTITALDLGADAVVSLVQFGEAVGIGASLYLNTSDNKWYGALNDTGQHAGQDGVGIALHAISAADRWGAIITSGKMYINGGLAEGVVYVVGDTAGDIAATSDATIGSGDIITILGVGGATNTFDEFEMNPVYTGHALL